MLRRSKGSEMVWLEIANDQARSDLAQWMFDEK